MPFADAAADTGAHGLLVGAAIVAVPAAVAIGAVTVLVKSLGDLQSTVEIGGEGLRVRRIGSDPGRHYVAIDDGQATRPGAWRVGPDLAVGLRQYAGR